MKSKLDSTLHKAILFNFSLNTVLWQYESTSPATWWDRDTQKYLRDGNRPFIALHFFRSDWDDHVAPFKFAVAFGITSDNQAWARSLAGPLYNAATSGHMHLVEKYLHSDDSFHVVISRQSKPELPQTYDTTNGQKAYEPYLRQTTSTCHLKLSISSAVVHGHSTFIINMTAESERANL
ncbi:hypothetical protein FHETE_2394 [Fusarium heterosporum]|uniref:Uncharacterized protein n=1 Tax=Fusarium heterosporum TaxID=42747 RepID=A0A8H5TR86_FUSHE|nr:hypothetical protein FHETE_2394 [Fusarium heterosporum]